MVLEFRNYRKKMKNKADLELDLRVEDRNTLLIVSTENKEIDFIRDSFRENTKFKGKILFDEENINKQRLLFPEDFGFYPHLNVFKNLKKMLQLFGVKMSAEEVAEKLEHINIDQKEKYSNLEDNEIIKLHSLFSILIEQKIIVFDYTEKALKNEDKEVLKELILEKGPGTSIVILDTSLNKYNDIAEDVLVISDGEKSYFGSLENLLIIKQLVALHISHKDSLDIVLKDYQYTDYNDDEIVVREDMLEKIAYELLKNGIEIYQMRNLGEKIKLYSKEDE